MNVFDKAIDEIKTRGWTKRNLINDAGEVCLIGACALAAGYKTNDLIYSTGAAYEDERYITTLLKVINQDFGYDTKYVYFFNDLEAQEVDDVVAVLEKASVRESEKV
jgi:hypothetical protein